MLRKAYTTYMVISPALHPSTRYYDAPLGKGKGEGKEKRHPAAGEEQSQGSPELPIPAALIKRPPIQLRPGSLPIALKAIKLLKVTSLSSALAGRNDRLSQVARTQ